MYYTKRFYNGTQSENYKKVLYIYINIVKKKRSARVEGRKTTATLGGSS